ncbi:hypothetical protein AGMMS50276_06290 [Synergistales bacterium]|nr:hypothetical protein AGMMS50276_06290 [Synergistales bacterium]
MNKRAPLRKNAKEPSITERLMKYFRDRKLKFVLLSALPASFRKGKNNATTKKFLSPHLGDMLTFRQGKRSLYLALKQPDEDLLLHIICSRAGKSLGVISQGVPFKRDEFFVALNKLLEQGRIVVTKISVTGGKTTPFVAPATKSDFVSVPSKSISEDSFFSAFADLESKRIFVRICDLRRRIGASREDFDAMLRKLRDAGRIQLHAGDVTTQTPDEVEDGFVDESGYRMGNVTRLSV